MVRILSATSLIVIFMMTSCYLQRKTPPVFEDQAVTPTHGEELNKQMPTLQTLNSNVWGATETKVTPVNLPYLTLKANTNCRHGPGLGFEVSTFGLAGQSYHIEGRNADTSWLYVRFNNSLRCWMGAATGTAYCGSDKAFANLDPIAECKDLNKLDEAKPDLDYPPTSGEACSTNKDKTSCDSNPVCAWTLTTAGPGYCTTK